MSRILITSALPYANGRIHLGHLAGAYLPADIYTKYQRLKKRDVIHVCGTDENGVQITIRAKEEGLSPKEVADKYYKDIKESFEKFGIEFDNFSRTSRPIHYKTAQEFFLRLYQKGYIFPKKTEQLYCSRCKQFLPDRYVEGICPYCGYDGARGDQCEVCGRWLEPLMLKKPRCRTCNTTPTKKTTKHWFFKLDLFQKDLEKWIKSKKEWKENVRSFALSWFKEGLEPRPITRDLNWGIPVPLTEAKGKVLYVWFDAPIGYISSTIEWDRERWKDYWCKKDTKLIHFIGKDNIVFHAIVWPAMLMGHGDFILPYQIPANEFLNLEGKPFSTSRNWAVWLGDYLKEFEPDPLRYTLTINAPERGDTDFTWDEFMSRNNNELSDILGNFVNRTLSFIKKYLGNVVPHPSKITAEDRALLDKIIETRDTVGDFIEHFELKKALREIMTLAKEGNRYFDYMKPWILVKADTKRLNTVIHTCTTLVANLGILIQPFLPFTSKKIKNMLRMDKKCWDEIGCFEVGKGKELGAVKILFTRVEKEKIEIEKAKLGTHVKKLLKPKIDLEDFEKLDLRIAEIKQVEKVKETKKLLKLKVFLGDKNMQIVAGIGDDYDASELIGKKIVVLTNLEPKLIHGEKSEGMLLAAVEKNKISLVLADKDIAAGSPIR